jgi:hypothetical protein
LLLRRISTRHRDEAVEIDLAEFDPSPAGSISLALNGMAMLRGSRQEAAQRSDVVLPILDGVDQLQKPFLEQLGAALLPRQRWILSARSLHDVPLRLRQSADATFVLDPLDDDEVERIVGNPSEPGRTTIAELRRQGLLEICRIPLFAHLVGALLRTDDEVPNSEAALLLRVFQRLVGPASTLELSRLDAYLRSLSFLFTRRGLASLKAADIAEALGPGAEGMYREAIRAGILVGAERVRFVHQRFQEAFAALAMVDAMTARRSPRELTNGLEWWNIGWWREPARMATQLRGGDFLKWLATDHPADSLDLTNEVGDIEPDLARAILRAARPRLGEEDARGACAALGVVDELEPLVRRGAGLDRCGLPQLEWLDCGGGLHVARYPVTNAQFRAYDSHRSPSHGAPRYAGDERWSDPVAGVTWQDAVDFCAWLSAQADLAIRLPAIAEWEIAAGGAEREYPWGVWMPGVCNVRATRIGARSPVGAFPRGNSPCGAADMSGNVWEWCIDSEGDRRAAKGGSWASYAHHATIAFTHWLDPQLRLDEVGFRPIMIRAFEVPH